MRHTRLLIAAIAMGIIASAAHAQSFPSSPITLVNPYAAGGPADLIARTVGAAMSEQIGQQIVILNKPGGATAIAPHMLRRRRRMATRCSSPMRPRIS